MLQYQPPLAGASRKDIVLQRGGPAGSNKRKRIDHGCGIRAIGVFECEAGVMPVSKALC